MDKLLPDILQQENKFQVIGTESQVLQLLLCPNETIYSRIDLVHYMSSNIKVEKANGGSQLVQLKNPSKSMGYAGLARRRGRIITVDLAICQNSLVNENNIIALNCCTFESMTSQGSASNIKGKYLKIKLDAAKLQKSSSIWLQTEGVLIEKDLGALESILVKQESIVLISEKMKIEKVNFDMMYSMSYVKVYGPGRIFFNNCGTQLEALYKYPIAKSNKLYIIFSLVIFVLFLLAPILEEFFDDSLW